MDVEAAGGWARALESMVAGPGWHQRGRRTQAGFCTDFEDGADKICDHRTELKMEKGACLLTQDGRRNWFGEEGREGRVPQLA